MRVHEPAVVAWIDEARDGSQPPLRQYPASLSHSTAAADVWSPDECVRLRLSRLRREGADAVRTATERAAAVAEMKEHGVPHTDANRIAAAAFDPPKGAAKTAGGALKLDTAEPCSEAVDGAAVLNEVVAVLDRFIALPPHAAHAIALWIAHTFVFDAFDITPLLSLGSPTKRCGKTATLRIIAGLVQRPLAASNISAPAIFRAVEESSPTLLIDEFDAAKENEDLRAVLNSGHTKDAAFVVRVTGEGSAMEPRQFSTWAPKLVAHIGPLADTLADRSIPIAMKRKLPDQRRESIRRRTLETLLRPLRSKLARLGEDLMADGIDQHVPTMPAGLDDRAADNFEVLLAIAEAVGRQWPERARAAAVALTSERAEDEAQQNAGVLLLGDLAALVAEGRLDLDGGLAADEACAELRKLDDKPWATWGRGRDGLQPVHLAQLLRPFGCRAEKVRSGGLAGVMRYPAPALREAFARYLWKLATPSADTPHIPPCGPSTPSTTKNPPRESPTGSRGVEGVEGVEGLEGCGGSVQESDPPQAPTDAPAESPAWGLPAAEARPSPGPPERYPPLRVDPPHPHHERPLHRPRPSLRLGRLRPGTAPTTQPAARTAACGATSTPGGPGSDRHDQPEAEGLRKQSRRRRLWRMSCRKKPMTEGERKWP